MMTTTAMGLTGAQLQLCLFCLLEGLYSTPGLTAPSLLLVALLSPSKHSSPTCRFCPYEVVAMSITIFDCHAWGVVMCAWHLAVDQSPHLTSSTPCSLADRVFPCLLE